MRNVQVYDLPTRILHWLFAGLFVTAYAISSIVDDESKAFSYHMIVGILLVLVVIIRIVWGLVGTKYAKLSSFTCSPAKLVEYLKGVLSGKSSPIAGHNPASSIASITIWTTAIGIGATGYLMLLGGEEDTWGDIHELLANFLLIVALIHIAGLLLHVGQHRDALPLSMIDGKKAGISAAEGISNSRSFTGLAILLLLAGSGFQLLNNFDYETSRLTLFGRQYILSEEQEDESESEESEHTESSKLFDAHEEDDD